MPRIPVEDVRAFWAEVQGVARKFAQSPRSGDPVYGVVAAAVIGLAAFFSVQSATAGSD